MKQKYVTDVKEFYEILLNDSIDNLNIQFINEEMFHMTYDMKDMFIDNSKDTNIFIVAFTTSHARMMLYEVLDKLGDQVLGYDTDSVWYIERSNGETIKTGDSLGDLTDELDGNHITDWCGTGPKSYSYTTSNGKNVCKVQGFTLNYENSKYINQESMKQLIEEKKERITNGETIKTGDSLGDLTDELDGNHITDWCGTGPKSYSYTTSNGKNVCKVQGFTLNYENSKYIN